VGARIVRRSRRTLPPLTALRAFDALARHRSVAGACSELNVTPAAVSHQIKILERWFGVPLIERGGRRLLLTAAGRRFFDSIRASFDQIADATERVLHEESHTDVEVIVPPAVATKWLLPRLHRFQADQRNINLLVRVQSAVSAFVDEEFDVAIRYVRYSRGERTPKDAIRFLENRLFPVCSPSLLGRYGPVRCPRDLVNYPLLHDDSLDEHDLWNWERWFEAVEVKDADTAKGMHFNLNLMTYEAAASGYGVALGKSALVGGDLESGRLVRPLPLMVDLGAAYFIMSSAGARRRPAVQAFSEWLLTEAEHGRADAEPGEPIPV
jgi:LysR family transcriptional regulator, glycine cleavage system transcriptional activator